MKIINIMGAKNHFKSEAKTNGVMEQNPSKKTKLIFSKRKDIKLFGVCANFLLAVISVAFFYSCKENEKCNTCAKEPDATELVTFNLMDKTISSKFDFVKVEDNGTYRESIYQYKTNEKLFQFIKNYCNNKNLVFDNQAMAFVLYYDSLVSKNLSVTDNNIKGISVYTVNKNKITHSLFLRNNDNNFYEEKNVKIQVPGVTTNHIVFYLKNYVFSDANNKSYILISGDMATDAYKNPRKYWAPMKYETSLRFVSEHAVMDKESTDERSIIQLSATGCGPDACRNGYWKMICLYASGGYYCAFPDGPMSPCALVQIYDIETNQEWKQFIDPNLMYNFSDGFLAQSDRGRKYIDDYYFLGEEWKGNINIGLAEQTILVLKDFNPVMRAFLEPDKHLNEIMFTSELSTSILNLLDRYQKITKSKEGIEKLNSVRKDIQLLENRRLGEILGK